ncbi:hypothetical protein ACMA1I_08975 [Pontibacter sp. 13R65]|uniref:hypothetical protein n=1 Tax=Pontibacter sp. 13R65 TaxID=3127458 RepID=UPI00301B9196
MKQASILLVPVLLCLLVLSGCALTKEQQLKRDYQDFKAWIANQEEQPEIQTNESWQINNAAYKAKTAHLDQQLHKLPVEQQQEYKQLKQQYEEVHEAQARIRLKDKWRNDLLEDAADTSNITSESLWQAYATFMSNVRLRCKKWEEQDWKMANEVYQELTKRQEEVYAGVTTEDQVRIKALQMEYYALRTSAEEEEEAPETKES